MNPIKDLSMNALHALLRWAAALLAAMALLSLPCAWAAPPTAPGQSATLLPDGRWLLLGGEGERAVSAWLHDAATGQTSALAATLATARAYHSATLLPDGLVLVLGGLGADGTLVRSAELFDPASRRLSTIAATGLLERARHTATLLMDGRVLVAGGVDARGAPVAQAELWNPATRQPDALHARLVYPRSGHAATLLAAEPVLLSGGRGAAGAQTPVPEVFLPREQRFEPAADAVTAAPAAAGTPAVAAASPAHGARDVEPNARLVLRFSSPLRVDTLQADTVTLMGPTGPVAARIVPAEGGRLLFVTPHRPLQPGAHYSLFISGAVDPQGQALPFTAMTFTVRTLGGDSAAGVTSVAASPTSLATLAAGKSTRSDAGPGKPDPEDSSAITPADAAEEDWIPGPAHRRGNWRARRSASPLQSLPALAAAPGSTALAGQVLFMGGQAGAQVTLRIRDRAVRADATGRFLLEGIPAGLQTLVVDGSSAGRPGRSYGYYEIRVMLEAGKTSVLPYTVWLPRTQTQHAVRLPSPTTAEIVVTTPFIPGLELHIPKGTVLRSRSGEIVTEVSITPIPVDRPPFPLPTSFVPVYFTIQPGGAHVQGIDPASARGARLIYPNYSHARPGARLSFWTYDPVDKGWYVYGNGRVSTDGRQVVPDPGVAIYEFTGAMVSDPDIAPPEGPPPGNCGRGGGEPFSCDVGAQPPEPQADAPEAVDVSMSDDDGQDSGGCAGDPVDCFTGLFVHKQTDLVVQDVLPIRLTRTYRTRDRVSRAFGVGATHPYHMFMVGDIWPYTYQELILPDGGRIRFNRVSAGTNFIDAVYEHTGTPTVFFGARLSYNSNRWKLALRNGTIYWFVDAEGNTDPNFPGLLGVEDRYGNRLDFSYDADGHLSRISTVSGRYVELGYDAQGRIIQAADHTGRQVGYAYDDLGRLATVTNPAGGVERYTYDSSDRMLAVTDARGTVVLRNAFDDAGRVSLQTFADSSTTGFAYTLDASGRVVQTDITGRAGTVRRMRFNAAGYVTAKTYGLSTAAERTFSYERNSATNQLLARTDAAGRRTEYRYDAMGNRTAVIRLAGTAEAATLAKVYEPGFSQVSSVTDRLGRTTTFTRGARGELTEVTNPAGEKLRLTYDAAGLPTAVTDALSHTLTVEYDAGEPVRITDALGRTATRYLDTAGRVATTTDGVGNTTSYEHDVLDRVTRITDPLGGQTSMAYDANGNLVRLTDPQGGVTAWEYDALNRVVARTDPLGQVERFGYDAAGNLSEYTDRNGKVATFGYDAFNRRTRAEFGRTRSGATLSAPDAVVTYTYDAAGRLVEINDTQGGTVQRSYDNLNRLVQETTPQGQVNYVYDAAGQRTRMAVAGAQPVDYAWDAVGRLTAITQGTAAVGFTYDAAGRRATLTLPNGVVASYGYDAVGQLTAITYTLGGTALGDLRYAYDAAGRRVRMEGSLARMDLPQPLSQASYNAANQLIGWAGTPHAYDANGNLLSDGEKTYTWDSRNRLVGLAGGANASFGYDALGRRASKTIAGQSTDYLYDGPNAVRELVGSTSKAEFLTGLGMDEVYARTDAAGMRNFITDALGSTLALTDTAGTVQTQYSYEPYGRTTQTGQPSENSIQYSGRENDATGLYYYRARYLDPNKSRFIQADPVGVSGGINLYQYVKSSPLTYVDLEGLAPGDKNFGINDPGFWKWWERNKYDYGPFDKSHDGFNPNKPFDIPNREMADVMREEYEQCKPSDAGRGGKTRGPKSPRIRGIGGRSEE
jgi:RHS repeat-associated protein